MKMLQLKEYLKGLSQLDQMNMLRLFKASKYANNCQSPWAPVRVFNFEITSRCDLKLIVEFTVV